MEDDPVDDTEPVEKPDLSADLPYDELLRYYSTKLWRKLRVFRRPVAPWDAPIVDNRVNAQQPDLFIHHGQVDRTRVDFKQKCTYNIDEQLPSNEITYGNYTKTPLWSFRAVKSEQIGRHPQVTICAENTRCTGCFNIVSGVKYDHHQFVYFGSGADQE